MFRCRTVMRSGTSLRQLQCYLCSICFLVLCIVCSSLFITSSLPLNQRHRMDFPLVINYKKISTPNNTIELGIEVGTPTSSVKVVNFSAMTSDRSSVASVPSGNLVMNIPSAPPPVFRKEAHSHAPDLVTGVKTDSKVAIAPNLRETDRVTSLAFNRIKNMCGRGGRGARTIYDDYRYLINEEQLCSGTVFVIIAVHSKTNYRLRRDLIRQTWGSVRHYNGHRIKLAFFVGRSDVPSLEKEVMDESRANRDIIQRDFAEHYRNMSHKHLSVLRWVADHCQHASYLVKVDDDTFINMFHTIHLLKMIAPRHFMCKVVTGYPVRSSRSSMRKWFVTRQEYPFKKYPMYCEGFAYLIDVAHARDLYWCAQFTKFFWIDDIFITGIVAKKLKVSRERLWNGHSWAESIPSLASEKIMDYVFIRAGHNEILPHLWMRLWKASLKYSY